MNSFFLDTYAMFEIAKGNPKYIPYTTGVQIATTQLQLMELYYTLLRVFGKECAERYYHLFQPYAILLEDDIIKEAMKFKLFHKNRNLSYVDCVGYMIAIVKKVYFLTGDRQFEDLPNVEYVK